MREHGAPDQAARRQRVQRSYFSRLTGMSGRQRCVRDARAVSVAPNEGWSDFLVASSGATAALTGLVFVAISINLEKILDNPGLPARAGQTLIVLTNALVASLVALAAHPSPAALGIALLVVATAGWAATTLTAYRSWQETAPEHRHLGSIMLPEIATLPFIVAGITVWAGAGGGLTWLLVGVVLALICGIGNAWVLLVEILR